MKKAKKFSYILGLIAILLIITTGCSKKESQSGTFPSAKSLVTNTDTFAKSLTSGTYNSTLKSEQMKVSSSLDGSFNGKNLANLNFKITSKGKTQTEQMWITQDLVYLLLEQNKGKWIKNSASSNNFDSDQVIQRFDPANFTDLNKSVAKHAIVKESGDSYKVTYSGTDDDVWKNLSVFIVDTMNTPGSQNMQVARALTATQPQKMTITYLVNKTNKMISKLSLKSTFTLGGQYNYSWSATYDELGQYSDLAVPNDIKTNAVDVSKQSNSN